MSSDQGAYEFFICHCWCPGHKINRDCDSGFDRTSFRSRLCLMSLAFRGAALLLRFLFAKSATFRVQEINMTLLHFPYCSEKTLIQRFPRSSIESRQTVKRRYSSVSGPFSEDALHKANVEKSHKHHSAHKEAQSAENAQSSSLRHLPAAFSLFNKGMVSMPTPENVVEQTSTKSQTRRLDDMKPRCGTAN